MADTNLTICNRALLQLGEPALSAMAAATDPARLATALYEPTVVAMLSSYRWNFARTTATLVAHGTPTPAIDFMRRYVRPAAALTIHKVEVNDNNVEFQLYAGAIEVDAISTNVVTCEYTARVAEADWPAYFIWAIETELMARFAFPITGQETVAGGARSLANKALQSAKLMDSQSQTPKRLPLSRFMTAR